MDDKGQVYVYEAVIVVLMIIVTVCFLITFISPPSIYQSNPIFNLQTMGDDVLRTMDSKGSLSGYVADAIANGGIEETDSIVMSLNKALPDASYQINIGQKTYYGTGSPGNSTALSHYLVIADDQLYDVQLLMWYSTLKGE